MTRIDQLAAKLKQAQGRAVHQPGGPTNPASEARPKPRHQDVGQLRHQLRQRSALLRQSAHDLKSSFGLIRGATHLLEQAETDDERQQFRSMLWRNLQQTNQVLTQLLDMTRLEAGEERRQLTMFRVEELLDGLVETVKPLAAEKRLWVRKQGADSLLIESNWVKLYRITQNLLLNALTYTKNGGVTLGWLSKADGQGWCLSVADTGPGIGAGRQLSGEGIGLVIVQQLCSLLDGQLAVDEAKGGGTRFIVSFPLRYSS